MVSSKNNLLEDADTKISILYVHESFQFGGAENSLLNLVTNLDKDIFEPHFACCTPGLFVDRLKELGISVDLVEFPRLRNSAPWHVQTSVKKLRKLIRNYSAQIIHSNTNRSNIYAGIAGRLENIKVVWHARNLLTYEKIDTDRVFSFLADRIICNSNAIRDRFKVKGHYMPKSVTIINGVNVEKFNPSIDGKPIREEFHIPFDVPLVGMTSRIAPGKGQEIFVKAAAKVSKSFPDAWFMLVGEASVPEEKWREERLHDMARELGIDDRTVFTGFRRDIPQILAAMDIFVLAADAEPCGRVLFEAQAMGKPVVATNTGGTPEIVADKITGLLIPPRDPDSIAQAVISLLSNDEKAKFMGRRGRDCVERLFTIEAHVRKVQKLYQSLLTKFPLTS